MAENYNLVAARPWELSHRNDQPKVHVFRVEVRCVLRVLMASNFFVSQLSQ